MEGWRFKINNQVENEIRMKSGLGNNVKLSN